MIMMRRRSKRVLCGLTCSIALNTNPTNSLLNARHCSPSFFTTFQQVTTKRGMGAFLSKAGHFIVDDKESIDNIKGFMEAGPLYHNIYSSQNSFKAEDEFERANLLSKSLQVESGQQLSPSMQQRVFHYYLPVFSWILTEKKKSFPNSPFFVGMSAPQGCGKTTLTEQLKKLFTAEGMKCAVVSIDDFYMTGKDQDKLAAEHPENPLLQCRGNAGSHDLALGRDTLQRLRALRKGQRMRVPRYDKAARSGRGDRAPRSAWAEAEGPLDVVLLEGWSLGFRALPLGHPRLAAEGPALAEVNARLPRYARDWEAALDAWLVVAVPGPELVFGWRREAEAALRAATGTGMTDDEVKDFCERYQPAYRAYLPGLYAIQEEEEGGTRGAGDEGKPTLVVRVGADRGPTGSWVGRTNAL